MNVYVILMVSAVYLGVLYAIANLVEHKSQDKRLISLQGLIYSLSIAVYCTSWTYYGSVGRSVKTGIGFLPIYIGPILVFVLGSGILRKMLKIAKEQRTTSIADFISARYGKSHAVAVVVAIICLIGILPYIALQLEAVTNTFNLLQAYPALRVVEADKPIFADTTFIIAVLIGLFVIVFGTRRVDVTEQHQGIVTAIAFESIVKLIAFIAVGGFVTFSLFGGFDDLFTKAAATATLKPLLDYGATMGKVDFWALTFLAGLAIFCLPRQFQVIFVENKNDQHLKPARWIFPLYLIAINIFVLPIALAGQLLLASKGANPDTYVLTLPVFGSNAALALFAFIGGLSAATGMIAVEAIALSTMVCNDLIMPMLISSGAVDPQQAINFGTLVKTIRRLAILFVVIAGCVYSKLIGGSYTLVSIGLLSFVASVQFAPAILFGLYWKRGNRLGALAGMCTGFLVWLYTLLLPSFAKSGWLPPSFVEHGLFGMEAFRPYALFGLTGLDPITHGLFWSLLLNVVSFVTISLLTAQSVDEKTQAVAFVDVFSLEEKESESDEEQKAPVHAKADSQVGATADAPSSRKEQQAQISTDLTLGDLGKVMERFIGKEQSTVVLTRWAEKRKVPLNLDAQADFGAVKYVETELTGVVGAAGAKRMMSSIAQFGRNSVWLNPISDKLLKK